MKSEITTMSARRKVLKYGLSSQKRFSQNIAEKILGKKGFVLDEKNSKCLFPHNKNESFKHWIAKAMLLKILMDRGRNVGSEIEVGNGIADIFDADTGIAYEIENGFSEREARKKVQNFTDVRDVFIINMRKIPDEMNAARKYLEGIAV